MNLDTTIEVISNLEITTRERGKIIHRYRGHNIWLKLGRIWLAKLLGYTNYSPLNPEEDNRIAYIGLGIGGYKQRALGLANSSPLGGGSSPNAYAGTNNQTDTDELVERLERPVRLSGSEDPYPGLAGDAWLGRVQVPIEHPTSTQSVFRRVFTEDEISYGSFLEVPISEAGLFTFDCSPTGVYNQTMVAYDVFGETIKTRAYALEVVWVLRT